MKKFAIAAVLVLGSALLSANTFATQHSNGNSSSDNFVVASDTASKDAVKDDAAAAAAKDSKDAKDSKAEKPAS